MQRRAKREKDVQKMTPKAVQDVTYRYSEKAAVLATTPFAATCDRSTVGKRDEVETREKKAPLICGVVVLQ